MLVRAFEGMRVKEVAIGGYHGIALTGGRDSAKRVVSPQGTWQRERTDAQCQQSTL